MMTEETRNQEHEFQTILEKHKEQVNQVMQSGGIIGHITKYMKTVAGLVFGGASLLMGLTVVAVLVMAGILSGQLAIALCVGGAIVGAAGIGTLGFKMR